MQNQHETLGEIIKNARAKADMTVETLANKVGVTERFIYRIENEGKKSPAMKSFTSSSANWLLCQIRFSSLKKILKIVRGKLLFICYIPAMNILFTLLMQSLKQY